MDRHKRTGRIAVAAALWGVFLLPLCAVAAIGVYGQYNTSGNSLGVAVASDDVTLFVADDTRTLQVIDISDPANPTLIATYDMAGNAQKVVLTSDDSKAFVPSLGQGLLIIDVSNPASPSFLGQFDPSGEAYGVVLSGDENTAYVAYGGDGVRIVDVSNPASPSLIGSYNTNGDSRAVALSPDGTLAYVADYDRGLKIIDVSNPASPSLLGSYNTNGDAVSVVLSKDGSIAYVGDGVQGLKIFDVSNPASPTLLGSYKRTGNFDSFDVTLSKDRRTVFMAYGQRSVIVVDVADPTDPVELEEYKVPGTGSSLVRQIALTTDQSVACFAYSELGIYTLDFIDYAWNPLVGYWKLDETAGDVAYDSSGFQNDGTLTNMNPPDDWVSGKCSGGLRFDGIDDKVIVPDDDDLDQTSELTVMYWCYPYTLDGNPRGPVCKRVHWTTEYSWSTFFYGGDRLCVDIETNDNRFYSNYVFNENEWYHIAVVFDGNLTAGERVKVYVNGVLDRVAYEASASISNTNSPVVLGQLNGNDDGYFHGVLDDVRVYRSALSADEIAGLMQCGSNLVAYWAFDEGSGQIAADSSGNGNHATLGSTAGPDVNDPSWVEGKCGSALEFDGVDHYVEASNSMSQTTNFTVAAWVKPYVLEIDRQVVSKGYDGTYTQWEMKTSSVDGKISFRTWQTGVGGIGIESTEPLTVNTWTHVTGVYDGTFWKLYINGFIDTLAAAGPPTETTQRVLIGAVDANGNAIQKWSGVIDEVRIYDRVLNDAEIAALTICDNPSGIQVYRWREVTK